MGSKRLSVKNVLAMHLRQTVLHLFMVFTMFTGGLYAQQYAEITSPTQSSPCVSYPVEVVLANDSGDPIAANEFQLRLPSGFVYSYSTLDDGVAESDPGNTDGPKFQIPEIEACESISFLIWLEHECISEDTHQELVGWWGENAEVAISNKSQARLFGVQLSLINVRIYLDSTDLKFKKAYSIVNTGKVSLSDFTFYVKGEDNMNILSANLGQLSANGDTLFLTSADFTSIGNLNNLFEPGETIDLIHEIQLDACEESFPFTHRMIVDCGVNTCDFEVSSATELKVDIGNPLLIVLQQPDQNATPCDSGKIILKLTNRSVSGSFPLANALFNLDLNTGWSFIRNGSRTDPQRDNCLRVVEVRIGNTNIPIITQGYTGYGIDLTRLTSDPDGPGGLSDADGDGRFDDLLSGDTICLEVYYLMSASCLNIRCSGEVFESRLFRMESQYNDYCEEDIESNHYINRHYYYWSGAGGSVGGLDAIYSDGEKDTLTIRLTKSLSGFLTDCPEDSAIIRITLPPVMTIPPDAVIIVNGDTTPYTYMGNRVTISGDTNRYIIQLPVDLTCDPNAGGGTIQTACTFCLGSGLPTYRVRLDMEYFCGDNCYGRLPLICYQSPEFFSVCDADAKGVISEGKFVIEEMELVRTTLGHRDSSKMQKVGFDRDSLNLGTLMTFDTFLVEIPFDIRCDANYTNVIFQLIQNSIIRINQGVRDTSKYFDFISDTIKFYDGESGNWSSCVNRLGNEFFNTQNNGYINNYIKRINLSNLGCLQGSFSSADSLVIIVQGVVRNEIRGNVQNLRIRSDLSYSQDGCAQNDRGILQFLTFSGLPNAGSSFLNQEYISDSLYKQYYSQLQICGKFEFNTAIDNYYYGVDTIDPFKNEYRKPYEIDHVQLVIPDFFEIDSLPFNYVREHYDPFTRVSINDTFKINYSVRDSANYYVVDFPIEDKDDFYAVRHLYRVDLRPNCYGFVTDTIYVSKFVKFQQQGPFADQNDTVLIQKYPINVGGIEPVIVDDRQQFFYDSLSVTRFSLNPATEGYEPQDYFDFEYSWLTIKRSTGHAVLDSLIECTDSTSQRIIPEVLPEGSWLIRLDSMYGKREYKLFSHIGSCGRDTIKLEVGSKCDGYPDDFLNDEEACYSYLESQDIILLPEVPDLIGKFLDVPDSTLASPCDTFEYLVEFRNANLGHLSNPRVGVDTVEGLQLESAEMEFPAGTFAQLGTPQLIGDQYVWDLTAWFDSTGFRGFFHPGLNELKIDLVFVGNCRIQDGAVVVVEMYGSDLCNEFVSSGRVNARPLFFERDSLSQLDSLYVLDVRYSGDTLCGDTFSVKAVFTSISDETLTPGQRVSFFFRKELSYVDGSYDAIRAVATDLAGYSRFEEWEQIFIDVPNGVALGDSMIFECQLARTCIGICKPTQIRFEVLSPKNIGCPSSPGGECQLLLTSQMWAFDSVVVAPYYVISDGEIEIVRQMDGSELWRTDLTIENLSSFGINGKLVIGYYEDTDGNGVLSSGDMLIENDTISSSTIRAFSKESISKEFDWQILGCGILAVISEADNACICNSDTLQIPTVSIKPISGSTSSCFTIDATVGFDPVPGYSYQWLSQGVISSSSARSDYEFSGQIGQNATRTDTLLLRADRAAGCMVIDTFYVEWYRPLVSSMVIDSNLCNGDSIASAWVNMEGGEQPISYLWSNGSTDSVSTGLAAGSYEVIVMDVNGCADTVQIIIDEPEPIDHAIDVISDYNGFPIKCHGDSTGNVSLMVSGGSPEFEYFWNGNRSNEPVLESLPFGWTKYRVVDKNGCFIEDSIFLDQPSPLELQTRSTKAGCDDDHPGSVMASAEGGVGGFVYVWSHGAVGDSLGDVSEGIYTVTVRDSNGCLISDSVEVERFPDPFISVNILDTIIEYGKSIRLTARSNSTRGIFVWAPSSEVSCDTCPVTTVTPTGNLVIQVRVVDENGCEAWQDIEIGVRYTKRVWAPNVFTPDGDDLNDGFTLFGNPNLEEIEELIIFDRWGELVFSKEFFEPGIPSLGWDGRLNEEEMNPAVFAWVARVRFANGERQTLFGDVTLLR